MKPVYKKILFIVLLFLLFLLFAQLYLTLFGGKNLVQYLKQKINEGTKGNYSLSIEKAEMNLFTTNIDFYGIKLLPGSSLIKKGDSSMYFFTCKYVGISGISVLKYLFKKQIVVDSITIKSPQIKSQIKNRKGTKETKKKALKPIPQLFKLMDNKISGIEVRKIFLDRGTIEFTDEVSKKIILNNIDFKIVRLGLYPEKSKKSISIAKEISINMSVLIRPDTMYNLILSDLSYSTRNSLKINNILLQPNHSKYEFAKVKGYQTDRYFLMGKEVKLFKFNLANLLINGRFNASLAVLTDFNFKIFRDKNLPEKKDIDPKFPQEFFRNSRKYFDVDSFLIEGAKITYTEHAKNKDIPGVVDFVDVKGVVFFDGKEKNEIIRAKGEAMVLGKVRLEANFNIPLYSKTNSFSFSGNLGSMEMGFANKILVPVTSIKVDKGRVNKVRFNASADSEGALGKVVFLYDDLKISMRNDRLKTKKPIYSSIANGLIFENNNPAKGKVREAHVSFKNKKNYAFFPYCWAIVLSGIKETVGVKNLKSEIDKRKVTEAD